MAMRKCADVGSDPRSHIPVNWIKCCRAACIYGVSAFVIGFCIGAFRVLLLTPKFGTTISVLIEAPLMLAVCWKISRWCMERFHFRTHGEAALMGTMAFAVLLFEETGMTVLVLGNSPGDYLAGHWSVPGAIGLVAQACFACFPFLQSRRL